MLGVRGVPLEGLPGTLVAWKLRVREEISVAVAWPSWRYLNTGSERHSLRWVSFPLFVCFLFSKHRTAGTVSQERERFFFLAKVAACNFCWTSLGRLRRAARGI